MPKHYNKFEILVTTQAELQTINNYYKRYKYTKKNTPAQQDPVVLNGFFLMMSLSFSRLLNNDGATLENYKRYITTKPIDYQKDLYKALGAMIGILTDIQKIAGESETEQDIYFL